MEQVAPLWLRSVPLVIALLLGLFVALSTRALTWLSLRKYRAALSRTPSLHWTERARLSIASRAAISACLMALPLQAAFLGATAAGTLSLAGEPLLGAVSASSAFLGVFFATRSLGRTLGFPESPWPRELRGMSFVLQAMLTYLVTWQGFMQLGNALANREAWRLAVALPCIAMAWPGALVFLFRSLGVLRKDDALTKSLEPVFAATRVRPRALLVAATGWANALAYPLNQTVVVTERLLELLSPHEVAAVVAHELGHLKEGPQARRRLLLLGFIALASFGFPFVPPDAHHFYFFGALVLFVMGSRLMLTWNRGREHAADEVAVSASDATTYASALEKLYEANLYPATQRAGTHPSLYDRLEKAGLTPDYPRPELPPRQLSPILLNLVLVPVFCVTWPQLWQSLSEDAAVEAVVTQRAYPLGRLALQKWTEGELETSIALYQRAEQLAPSSAWYPRNLAAVLYQAGDCQAAQQAAARAKANATDDPSIADALFVVDCAAGNFSQPEVSK